MRVWIDTEFVDNGPVLNANLELISIGLVREDGRELYYENAGFIAGRAPEWHKQNVLPKLSAPRGRRWLPEIARDIKIFLADVKPEFWAYYASYDWVLFCKLFGGMEYLPEGWPHLCLDVKQLMIWIGLEHEPPHLVQDPATKHHALHDARWLRNLHKWVDEPD